MRHVPSVVGGVRSRSLLHTLAVLLATVGCLTLLVGSASAGPPTQQQQTRQPQKTVTADEVKALQQKAEQGDATAQCTLGDAYRSGRGVPQDDAQAAAWYRKAAEQGNARAQAILADSYVLGRGVPQDYAQAVAWVRKAAEQGVAEAQHNLGSSYFNGQGVQKDYAQAVVWYRKAAEQGEARAQYNMAAAYASGQGVSQDFIEAFKWSTIAAVGLSGDQQKANAAARETLATRMLPEQIAEAQKRANEWLAAFEKRKK